MKTTYLISWLAILSLLSACGGGSSKEPTISTTQNKPSDQQPPTNKPSIKEKKIFSNLSLSECIDKTLSLNNSSLSSLKTVACENLQDRDFHQLSSLSSLTSLTINNTDLSGDDIENLGSNLDKSTLQELRLENDNLNKRRIDRLIPNFSYDMDDNQRFYKVDHISFKDNQIEGLQVMDYFPNSLKVNLSGDIFPDIRLHHIQYKTKNLDISNNPNIKSLDDFKPELNDNIEVLNISNLQNLENANELLKFNNLKKLIIDKQNSQKFKTILDSLRSQGVEIAITN